MRQNSKKGADVMFNMSESEGVPRSSIDGSFKAPAFKA
jgi:hypothetical protein